MKLGVWVVGGLLLGIIIAPFWLEQYRPNPCPTVVVPKVVIPMHVTAYHPYPPSVAVKKVYGYTATKKWVLPGMCAADWRFLPPGSLVKVPGYGLCTIEDSGNEIKGWELDVFFPFYEDAVAWGHPVLPVEVLRWGRPSL